MNEENFASSIRQFSRQNPPPDISGEEDKSQPEPKRRLRKPKTRLSWDNDASAVKARRPKLRLSPKTTALRFKEASQSPLHCRQPTFGGSVQTSLCHADEPRYFNRGRPPNGGRAQKPRLLFGDVESYEAGDADKSPAIPESDGGKSSGSGGRFLLRHLAKEFDESMDKLAERSENEGIKMGNFHRKYFTRSGAAGLRSGHRYFKGREQRAEKRKVKHENKQLIRETKERAYEQRHGKPPLSKKLRQKLQQKKQQARRFAEKKLGKKTVNALEWLIGKIVNKATTFVIFLFAHFITPIIAIAILYLGVTLLILIIAGAVITNTTVIIASYSAEPSAIEQASAYYTQLEAEMEKKILDAPTSWEWGHIDEFRYDLDPIGHDPYQIMAYLNVKHPGFTLTPQSPEDSSFEEVKTEIDYIFDKRYDLIFDEEIEVRSYTVDYDDPDGTSGSYTVYYNYYILNIILRSKEQEPVLLEELARNPKEELTEWYEVLQQSQGARQDYANPLPFDWRESVSSLYGYRIDPIGGRELQMHRGLDIAAPRGTPIVAGISGRVRYTGFDSIMGNYIILTDENDKTIKYGHCDSIEVETGVEVKAGETIIGTVGNTGQSTGAHLHVEIMELGDYLDPVYSLNFAA